jgi:hypothetical protein
MNIRLTESKFKNMLTEMVKDVLNEAKMSLDDIYNKYYSNIDKNIFLAAVNADPTSKRTEDGNIIGIGDYTKWILKLYQNGSWKPGDSVETKDLLGKFNKHQKRLPIEQRDINRYSSVRELYDSLKPYLNIQSRSEIKQEAEKVYEDNEWLIIIPHTKEAACYYGANTRWCTAAKENNMFDYYNNYNDDGDNPLYINIHKPTNRKYQFHFESDSFMDEEDEEINLRDLPWTEGALNYYVSIGKKIYFMGFDYIYDSDANGITEVELMGKENWFDKNKNNGQGELVWDKPIEQWFDGVSEFDDNGIARVKLNGKGNLFNINKNNGQGGLVSPDMWFDYYYYNPFDFNGTVKVTLKGEWFLLTLDGQLLDYDTEEPLSQEQVQELFQQQQIAEMVNRLVKNYLR